MQNLQQQIIKNEFNRKPKLLKTLSTDINIDCIKVCPFQPQCFAIGHYEQQKNNNGQTIKGGISLFYFNIMEFKVFIQVPPILHLCWINKPLLLSKKQSKYNQDELIGIIIAACRDASLRIYGIRLKNIQRNNKQTQQLYQNKQIIWQIFQIKIPNLNQDLYCLYCDADLVDQSSNQLSIVISTNKQILYHYKISLFPINILSQTKLQSHQYAIWCCRLHPMLPLITSGDQLNNLHIYDIRTHNPSKPILINKKSHQAGISDICYAYPIKNPNIFITGCFQGWMRWFDTRMIKQPFKKYKTNEVEGVLWRINPENFIKKQQQQQNNFLLNISSANIFQIITQKGQSQKYKIQNLHIINHDSLAYSSDWNRKNIITASFYDKIVCLWER